MTDREQAERALAFVVHAIRPDWDEPGILAAIRKAPAKPLATVAAAAIACASLRTDQRTPACIALDGDHWQAKGVAAPVPPYHEPRCTQHRQPLSCPDCRPRRPPADAATIRAIREQARRES